MPISEATPLQKKCIFWRQPNSALERLSSSEKRFPPLTNITEDGFNMIFETT
jgi:hypothetical protein